MHQTGGVRTTDKLQEVNLHHLVYGRTTLTLCISCLNNEVIKPSFIQTVEVTANTPHTACNRCGAITTDDYARRFS